MTNPPTTPLTTESSRTSASRAARATPPPPWIATLPADARGFHIPAETPWDDGQPRLSKVGVRNKTALGLIRSCAVCGYFLKLGEPVFRAFSQADAAAIRVDQRELTWDMSGPAHRSCMLYSALVCPYLREPTAKLGQDTRYEPGARRGRLAAVMGFDDAAMLIHDGPHEFLSDAAPLPQFAYRGLTEDIKYRHGADLLEQFDVAVEADRPNVDLSQNQHYWTADDNEALNELLISGWEELGAATPAGRMRTPEGRYAIFTIPRLGPAASQQP